MRKIISSLLALIISAIMISAYNAREIAGKVSNDQGTPLSGVKVSVKSTVRGTVTDNNGNYKLSVLAEDKILVFSLPGMQTKEVEIKGQNIINAVLESLPASDREYKAVLIKHKHASYEAYSMPYVSRYAGDNSYNYTGHNTENYGTIHENGFKDALIQPLSTFSIDVDRASYSNIRRFINMGQLPPVDAVRIEEMLNYFSYKYTEPEGKNPFSVYTELSVCPWNRKNQLLHIGLKGKSMEKSELPPSNLVFLIDVSGSMNMPNKLPLLKSSFRMLVKELRDKDKVAIVVYAGAAGLVLESTPGSQKEKILASIEKLEAGGSTAGGQGLLLAYKVAGDNYIETGNNRIILATDGDFNVGVSSNAEMERLVEEERKKGIFITVLGYGMGNYKDDRLEIIANKGNGNYGYIDNIQEARKMLVTEFSGTLFTIAKDVKFQIEFNPARVKGYRLIGYENRMLNAEDFNDDRKDAGEAGAGHNVTALYEIIPAGADADIPGVDTLKYQQNNTKVKPDPMAEILTVKLRYKLPDENTSILFDKPVSGKLLALEKTSDNFRFSAAVAEFGMVLRESEFKGSANLSHVIDLAKGARGDDEEGYRSEFLSLVRMTENLKKQ